jgi:uncharacterized protein
MLLAAMVVMLAGLFVGLTSIGGVLVMPALHHLGGMAVSNAVACASVAMVAPGLWVIARARAGMINWALVIGAALGAYIGAQLVHVAPSTWLLGVVGAICVLSGAVALQGQADVPLASPPIPATGMVAMGTVVGLLSALTGTGGPVVLLPIMMLLRRPLAQALTWALVVQLPIGVTASLTHALEGRLVLGEVLVVGSVLLIGFVIGQHFAQRLALPRLRAAVAATLLACGVVLIAQLIAQ